MHTSRFVRGGAVAETERARRSFAWLATVIFIALTVPRLLLHELWRDEAWLWLVVTESRSFDQLLGPLARSGQGSLFPMLCYLARQVSASPRMLQWMHLLLGGFAAFVFALKAPFGRRQRALFLLGYFPFYEYAVISRHYVAGALLVWLACASMRGRRPALAMGLLLGLLCQTTVYGIIMALALACGWLVDRRLHHPEVSSLPGRDIAVGLVLGLAGLVAGVMQIIPAPGTSFAPEWHFGWESIRAREAVAMPWKAFAPVPHFGLHFWNTNLLDPWPLFEGAAGLLMLMLAVVILRPRKAALVTFCVGTAGILAFGYVKYAGVSRHYGHLWLLFFAALWIGELRNAEGMTGEQTITPGERLLNPRSWRTVAVTVLLIIQCGASLFASWMDLRYPFSNGAAAAQVIRHEGLDRLPMLGYREPPAATVALYLGRSLYSPSRHLFVTHPDWGPQQRDLTEPELRCAARQLASRTGMDIALVMNRELRQWDELEPGGSTVGAIVPTEDYFLYRLRLDRLAKTVQAARCEAANEKLLSPH